MRYLIGFVAATVRVLLGLILLIAALTCACCFDLPESASPAYVQGRIIGTAALTLIFGVVGFKMITRHLAPRYFFIFALVLIAIALPEFFEQRQQQKHEAIAALTSIQQKFAQTERASVDSDGFPVRVEPPPLTTPKARGDFGQFERLMSELLDRVVAQRNDYLAEWEAIGWESLLDARRIDQDRSLAESRTIVKQAHAIVDKYEARTATLIRDLRARIHALPVSDKVRQEMLAGFDKSLKKDRLGQHWALEKRVVREFSNIIELLATAQHGTGWVVEGDQIQFLRDQDLTAFNSHLEEINRIAQDQDQIHSDSLSVFNRKLEETKRELAQ
jgi:hypothetical protein